MQLCAHFASRRSPVRSGYLSIERNALTASSAGEPTLKAVRSELKALVKDIGLTTIGLGVAFGYALISFAGGFGQFVDQLFTHVGPDDDYGGGLTWVVGRHVISLDLLVIGAIELVVVCIVGYLVLRRRRPVEASEA